MTMARLRELLPDVFAVKPGPSLADGDSSEDGAPSSALAGRNTDSEVKGAVGERSSDPRDANHSETEIAMESSALHPPAPPALAQREDGKTPSFVPFSATAASKAIPWKSMISNPATAVKASTVSARGYREELYRVFNEPVSAILFL